MTQLDICELIWQAVVITAYNGSHLCFNGLAAKNGSIHYQLVMLQGQTVLI